MSRTPRKLLLLFVCLAVVVGITSAVLIARASIKPPASATQTSNPTTANRGPRNLYLQPEAIRVARRLGKRFGPSSRAASMITGTLTMAGSAQSVKLTRQQTKTGETVEVVFSDRWLSWNERERTNSSSTLLSDSDRLLIERLTLDSPDHFVLAQLRGASYLTVARNVRPADAQDGYAGPLWNLVRVDERQQDDRLRPQSTWRIYYINAETELPERVEYQLNGQEIRVQFLEWTEQQGEKTPSYVRWTSSGQPLMEYRAAKVVLQQ